MTKFAPQIATALRLIKAKGVLLTYTRVPESPSTDINLADDSDTGGAEAPVMAQGWSLVLPPTTQTEQTYQAQFASGSLKITNVQRLLIACSGMAFVPDEGDETIINGETWEVLGGKVLNPDATLPIVAELTIKR